MADNDGEEVVEVNGQTLRKVSKKKKKDAEAVVSEKPKKKRKKDDESELPSESEVAALILSPVEKEELRANVRLYRDKIETYYFDFASEVYKVYDSAAYLDWTGPVHDDETDNTEEKKYSSFAEYVENELGISSRTADYFVSMSRFFEVDLQKFPEVKDKVKKLGWSKTKELVGVVDETNVDEWVEKANRMTVTQLAAACRAALRGDDDDKAAEAIKRKSFTFAEEQLVVVESALEHAKETGSTDKDGQAMTLICQDYLAGAVRPREGSQQIAYIKRMEGLLGGLKLIAVDADSKKIVFGKKTFQNLSED